MDWNPIATAPKDGTRILVGFGNQSGFPVKEVFFNTLHKFWSHYGTPEFGIETNATHWTPILRPRECSDDRPCVNRFADQGECLCEHTKKAMHILRNPFGWSSEDQRRAALDACNAIEGLANAYENMRKFAEDNGLDTVVSNTAHNSD